MTDSYTLVEYIDDGEVVAWELENPDGEILEEYDSKPAHPKDTAPAIEDDFSNNPRDMFLFVLQRNWDFRTEHL